MYNVGDKVVTLWQGEFTTGRIIEVVHGHCYRVRLTSGEVAYRLESDLEKGGQDDLGGILQNHQGKVGVCQ